LEFAIAGRPFYQVCLDGELRARSRCPGIFTNGEIWGYPGNSPKSNFLVE
jgi:hypothetical protein